MCPLSHQVSSLIHKRFCSENNTVQPYPGWERKSRKDTHFLCKTDCALCNGSLWEGLSWKRKTIGLKRNGDQESLLHCVQVLEQAPEVPPVCLQVFMTFYNAVVCNSASNSSSNYHSYQKISNSSSNYHSSQKLALFRAILKFL